MLCSLACHPSGEEVACGFLSGALRVVDAARAELVQELDVAVGGQQQQQGPRRGGISQLAYARHGRLLLSRGESRPRRGMSRWHASRLFTRLVCTISPPLEAHTQTCACLPLPATAGEDGCVCVYDAQRSYLPIAYLLPGPSCPLKLHATAMAVSQDGRLVAVASTSCAASASAGGGPHSSGSGAATAAPLALSLFDATTLQLLVRQPLAGRSRVVQLQLLPDARHCLALTANGRLLGYRCCMGDSGSPGGALVLVLDIPRCLDGPCSAAALDPSGTFLVAAAAASGQLKVWGLHQLLHQPRSTCCSDAADAPPSVIATLPCQQLATPPGSAVLGAAFLGSGQLLTAGRQGEVCSWAFRGQTCGAPAAVAAVGREPVDASTGSTLLVRQPLAATSLNPSVCSMAAGCRAAGCRAVHSAFTSGGVVAMELLQQQRRQRQGIAASNPCSRPAPCAEEDPVPRALPKALAACRPPSAPPSPAWASAAASLQPRSRPATATPARPRTAGTQRWSPQPWVPPEATLLITATGSHRDAKTVRHQTQLHITAASRRGRRTAAWVTVEEAGDRIPRYRPEHQIALAPPEAAVLRVLGFEAGAGFCRLPAADGSGGGNGGGSQGQLVYAAGNVVVEEALPLSCSAGGSSGEGVAEGRQQHLARLPSRITALAVTADGQLLAAAAGCLGEAAGGANITSSSSTSGIYLIRVDTGATLAVLECSQPVQVSRRP